MVSQHLCVEMPSSLSVMYTSPLNEARSGPTIHSTLKLHEVNATVLHLHLINTSAGCYSKLQFFSVQNEHPLISFFNLKMYSVVSEAEHSLTFQSELCCKDGNRTRDGHDRLALSAAPGSFLMPTQLRSWSCCCEQWTTSPFVCQVKIAEQTSLCQILKSSLITTRHKP